MAGLSSYPALLTVSEAAVVLGLSPFTVGQMCRDGRLPRLRMRRIRPVDPHSMERRPRSLQASHE